MGKASGKKVAAKGGSSAKVANKQSNKSKRRKNQGQTQSRKQDKDKSSKGKGSNRLEQEGERKPARKKRLKPSQPAQDVQVNEIPTALLEAEDHELDDDYVSFFGVGQELSNSLPKALNKNQREKKAREEASKKRIQKRMEARAQARQGGQKEEEGGQSAAASEASSEGGGESDEDSSDAEASYERRPRSSASWEQEEERQRKRQVQDGLLKVKSASGEWVKSQLTVDPNQTRRGRGADEAAAGQGIHDEASSAQDEDGSSGGEEAESMSDDGEEEAASEGEGEAASKRRKMSQGGEAKRSAPAKPPPTQEELKKMRLRRLQRIKMEMAGLADKVVSDPNKHIGKMHQLHLLVADEDKTVVCLAILTQAEVFKDIMPSYRIRPLTKDEAGAQVSKEVMEVRSFERSFLAGYNRFVQYLCQHGKAWLEKTKALRSETVDPHLVAVCRSVCALVLRGYNFNYRKELVNAFVPLINCNRKALRSMAMDTAKELFQEDIGGDCVLEIVRRISATTKKRNGKVKPEMVEIFFFLPLSKTILESAGDPMAQLSRKQKFKVKKAMRVQAKKAAKVKRNALTPDQEKQLHREIREAEAEVSIEHRKRVQTEMLTEVIVCYFRILKRPTPSPILPSVLQGLSRFAHLINLELILDLLDHLKRLVSPENPDPLPVESALHLVLASFKMLSGHGSALTTDLKEFYVHLYGLLWKVTVPENSRHVPLLLECLQLMFAFMKQLSTERVASFVKRLATVGLTLPAHAALAVCHTIRLCFAKYERAQQLLETDTEAGGAYLPALSDPDLANPFASTAWELSLLGQSYHPYLNQYLSALLKTERMGTQLMRMPSSDMYKAYDSSLGGFNPPIRVPGKGSSRPNKTARAKRKALMTSLSKAHTFSPFLSSCMAAAASLSCSVPSSPRQQASSSSHTASLSSGLLLTSRPDPAALQDRRDAHLTQGIQAYFRRGRSITLQRRLSRLRLMRLREQELASAHQQQQQQQQQQVASTTRKSKAKQAAPASKAPPFTGTQAAARKRKKKKRKRKAQLDSSTAR